MILIPKFNRTIKTIIYGLFLLSILLAQPLRQVRPEAVGMSSDRLDRLTQQMESYVLENQLSGGVTLVLRHGKIAYFDAFGYRDTESKDNMEIDDIFRIASQTKAMISVGIMILQEKGQLLISDPVGKYIPKYNSTTVAVKTEDGYKVVPANRQITIRDLLTHTAGVGWGFGPGGDQWKKADIIGWYFAHRKTSIQSTVNQISSLPMDAQPGEQFVYGLSTDILGALIEVVSGQPLDKFLQKGIFNPLEMTDTHFYLPVNKHHRLSTVYSSTENGIALSPNPGKRIGAGMIGQGHYINGPRKSFSGGAGLLSTAEDYATFLQMMLNGGTFNKQRILSRKSVELMTVDHLGSIEFPWTNGVGFGLGFSIVKDLGKRGTLGSEGEFGWGGAYHSTYWVDPKEDLVVVYFTQLIPANNIDDQQKLRSLIYQAIID
ncbi:MAG: serine hydrolase domain-containing protein [Candidatus Marinimicrobia bacterium]|jgi:CubicO group peptidase (beta-lactamase class C family)|nr:beta-lactamase family protein [Candidatus Neomarinimicrobiota bacterium]MDP6202504.1 serine hydrolase domain-containing protein [Candidatus Neomarinimicrobiota bacterium]